MQIRRPLAAALTLVALLPSGGCAALFRGTSQTVRVLTQPAGGTVIYQGREVRDGESITVQKHFDAPQFDVGDGDRPVMVDMTHSMDPWLIGDGALLFVFVVPGLVGGGVDFGTGAWRRLDDPQVVHLIDR